MWLCVIWRELFTDCAVPGCCNLQRLIADDVLQDSQWQQDVEMDLTTLNSLTNKLPQHFFFLLNLKRFSVVPFPCWVMLLWNRDAQNGPTCCKMSFSSFGSLSDHVTACSVNTFLLPPIVSSNTEIQLRSTLFVCADLCSVNREDKFNQSLPEEERGKLMTSVNPFDN